MPCAIPKDRNTPKNRPISRNRSRGEHCMEQRIQTLRIVTIETKQAKTLGESATKSNPRRRPAGVLVHNKPSQVLNLRCNVDLFTSLRERRRGF